MSSPLPGNAHTPGSPPTPSVEEDWPGTQRGAALRELSSFSQVFKQALMMPWKQVAVLLVWAVLVPAGASFIAYELMMGSIYGAASGSGFGTRNALSTLGFGALGILTWAVYMFVALATAAFVPAFAAENIRARLMGYQSSAKGIWASIRRVVWRILGYTALVVLILSFGLGIVIFVFAIIFGILFAVVSGGPVAMLIGLLVAAVILAGLAGLIWLAAKLAFVPSAMVFEGVTIMAAISRSWKLTKGRVWRTIGTLLVVSLPFVAAGGLIGMVVGAGGASDFSTLSGSSANPLSTYDFSALTVLSDVLTEPITALGALGTAIASTLLYLDARGKTERLDLTLENWQNGINQGVPAQHMGYPFATPVVAPTTPGWQGA